MYWYLHQTYLLKLPILQHQRTLQPSHLIFLAVDENNVFWVHFTNEISVLHEVNVRRKADVVHEAIKRLATSLHGYDFLWLEHDLLSQCILDSVTGNQNAILRVGRPSVKKLTRYAGLKHTWRGEDDTRTAIVEGLNIYRFEVADETE